MKLTITGIIPSPLVSKRAKASWNSATWSSENPDPDLVILAPKCGLNYEGGLELSSLMRLWACGCCSLSSCPSLACNIQSEFAGQFLWKWAILQLLCSQARRKLLGELPQKHLIKTWDWAIDTLCSCINLLEEIKLKDHHQNYIYRMSNCALFP